VTYQLGHVESLLVELVAPLVPLLPPTPHTNTTREHRHSATLLFSSLYKWFSSVCSLCAAYLGDVCVSCLPLPLLVRHLLLDLVDTQHTIRHADPAPIAPATVPFTFMRSLAWCSSRLSRSMLIRSSSASRMAFCVYSPPHTQTQASDTPAPTHLVCACCVVPYLDIHDVPEVCQRPAACVEPLWPHEAVKQGAVLRPVQHALPHIKHTQRDHHTTHVSTRTEDGGGPPCPVLCLSESCNHKPLQ
jgi:hypothetical protein